MNYRHINPCFQGFFPENCLGFHLEFMGGFARSSCRAFSLEFQKKKILPRILPPRYSSFLKMLTEVSLDISPIRMYFSEKNFCKNILQELETTVRKIPNPKWKPRIQGRFLLGIPRMALGVILGISFKKIRRITTRNSEKIKPREQCWENFWKKTHEELRNISNNPL